MFHAPAGEGIGLPPKPAGRGSRSACPSTFERVPRGRLRSTHTCDLTEGHDGEHHCPVCNTRWTRDEEAP